MRINDSWKNVNELSILFSFTNGGPFANLKHSSSFTMLSHEFASQASTPDQWFMPVMPF